MTNLNRREFLNLAGGTFAIAAMGFPMISFGAGKRVVVVGGGMGGATAAKYMKMEDPSIDITLIEANQNYHDGRDHLRPPSEKGLDFRSHETHCQSP